MKFVHLHTHSHYSLLDGLSRIDELIAKAKEMGMEALAITDHGVMYGAIEFYKKAKKAGIKPIIGCLPPGHLIITRDGIKSIESIKVGDMVLTHKGRFKKVSHIMSRSHSGKIYGIKAANSNTVWVTEEHPILVTNSHTKFTEWRRADQLDWGRKNKHGGVKSWKLYASFPKLKENIEDTLSPLNYLDKNYYGIVNDNIRKIKKYNKYDSLISSPVLSSNIQVTNDFAYFLGLFIAEGSFQKDPKGRPTSLTFTFNIKEDYLVSKARYILDQLSPNKTSIAIRPNKNITEIHHSNTLLARFMYNFAGHGAGGKRIPPSAFYWSLGRLESLLSGIVAGDGRINRENNNAVVLRVKSRDLAWGVKLVAAKLGYPCKVSERQEGKKTIYQICWSPNGKYKRILEDDKYLYLPIKTIETKYYSGPVYNFTVEEDNSYVSDIILHNCELYMAENSMHDKRAGIDDKRYHLIVLAENETGYKNLIKLVSAAHLEGFYYKPRVDKELLKKHSNGLIGLSACLGGEISRAISSNNFAKAKKIALDYEEIFGKGNFFIELQQHPHIEDQNKVTPQLIKLAKETGIPLVATQDSHYLNSDDAHAHDVLLAVQTGNKLDDNDRLTMKDDNFSLLHESEMYEKFKSLGENVVEEAFGNTNKIAERCNLEIELGKTKLPFFHLPENYKNADEYLKKLSLDGLSARYGDEISNNIHDRLEYELKVITQTGFASYFLIVQDFVNWAKQNGIIVGPGRGSAAGSLVSYLLGITNIDPLKYNLLFERFLNPERVSMPDIDLDFDDARRNEVLKYVADKYGHDHVAQVITFGTMAARGSIRDAGRALGYSYDFCDKIAKMIPLNPNQGKSSLKKAVEVVDELKQAYDTNPDVKKLIDSASRLEGVARHSSTHACAVVITPEPLTEYLPLQRGTNEEDIITQYDMHTVGDDLGLLKIDFLGLANLTIINNALTEIKRNHGIDIDIDALPLDDKKTFKLLREAKTTGIFQLESNGMKRYLKELKPTSIEDIIVMISLYRPGPLETGMVEEYIERKHGRKKISYLHPLMEPILNNTYGIIIYQEQLMQIANTLANFTLPQGYTLIKAVGKKIKSLLDEQREKLIDGMVANNINKVTAEKVWDFIEPFARYGFNRSHAACYAMIGYQTAYLKANYPTEFMAAFMNSETGDIERVAFLIEECKDMGIEVLPPSIDESYERFAVVPSNGKPAIRFGLTAVKNVGENVVSAIIKERRALGSFKNAEDLVSRIQNKDLNKKSLESLIKCGAMDTFGERNTLIHNLEALLSHARDKQKHSSTGQVSLFGNSVETELPPLRLATAEPAKSWEKLLWEKELLGLYVSDHPLNNCQAQLKLEKVVPIKSITLTTPGSIKIGGIVTRVQKIVTKNGKPMLFSHIEDLTSKIELVVFPNVLEKNPEIWKENSLVVARGKVNDRDGVLKLLCDEVKPLMASI